MNNIFLKLWIWITRKRRIEAYKKHRTRLMFGEPTIKNVVRSYLRENENVDAILMPFDIYLQWHMEENIEQDVTLCFGRVLEIDGVPIEVDMGDSIRYRRLV